jgi:hypothetical protein
MFKNNRKTSLSLKRPVKPGINSNNIKLSDSNTNNIYSGGSSFEMTFKSMPIPKNEKLKLFDKEINDFLSQT